MRVDQLQHYCLSEALAWLTLIQTLFFLKIIGMGFAAEYVVPVLAAVLHQNQQLVFSSLTS
jgi:hypothetical protein